MDFGKLGIVIVAIAVVFPATWTFAEPVLFAGNGHYYEAVACESNLTWDEARGESEARTYQGTRGHLATITSQEEQDFIRQLGKHLCMYWLGGLQPAGSPEPAGNWRWITGEPWGYTNWNGGEPNNHYDGEYGGNLQGSEEALHGFASGVWNDCERTVTEAVDAYIVEYPVNDRTYQYAGPDRMKADRLEAAGRSLVREHTIEQQITQAIRQSFTLSLPAGFDRSSTKKYPLIVMHRYGGPWPRKIRFDGESVDFPFVVLSTWALSSNYDDLNALLDHVIAEHNIDTNRVYLTGFSSGSAVTWAWAVTSPDRFAAIAPLCGFATPTWAKRVAGIPVWVFHGAKDFIPVSESERMVEAMRAVGGTVRFTVYPELGHGIWDRTYQSPELYEWFLTHSRSDERGEEP